MQIFRFVVLGLIFCSISAFGQSPSSKEEAGKLDGDTYTCPPIGWSIKVPDGWEVMPLEEVEALAQSGAAALQDAGTEINVSGLTHLLNIRKGTFEILQSTIEPYDPEIDGDWSAKNVELRIILLQTFEAEGIRAEASDIQTETIDGLEFEFFTISLFLANGKKVLEQTLYSRLINGFDFGVNISTQNEKDRATLLKAWRSSTFAK